MTTSIFTTYSRDLSAYDENTALALKDYQQLPVIMDVLSRKDNHHLALSGTSSPKIQLAILESLAFHLTETSVPKALRGMKFIYFDAKRFASQTDNLEKTTQEFFHFYEDMRYAQQRFIFAINSSQDCVAKWIQI